MAKKNPSLKDPDILKSIATAVKQIQKDKSFHQYLANVSEKFKQGKIDETTFLNEYASYGSARALEAAEKKGVKINWKAIKHQSISDAEDIPFLVKKGYDLNALQDHGQEQPYSFMDIQLIQADQWSKKNDEDDKIVTAIDKVSLKIRDEALAYEDEYKTATPKRQREIGAFFIQKRQEMNENDEKLIKAMDQRQLSFTLAILPGELSEAALKTGQLNQNEAEKAHLLIQFVKDFKAEKAKYYSPDKKENSEKEKPQTKREKPRTQTAYLDRINADKLLMANLTGNMCEQSPSVSSRLAEASGIIEEMPKEQALAHNQSASSKILSVNGKPIHFSDTEIQNTVLDKKESRLG